MNNRWKRLRAALAASVLIAAGTANAGTPIDGLSFRAVGFFEAEASTGGDTCTIPTADDGVPVNSDQRGLWNTFGIPTISYPESICKGWLELQNVMTSQGVSVDRVQLSLRIAGANRFRQFVPTRNGFPTACRSLRKSTVFTGAHLFPFGTSPDFGNTGSGQAHLAFVNMLPMVDAQVIHCLREQYAALPSNVYVSFPLIITAVATGISDSGQRLKSNPVRFTLTLHHLCGNGRIDNLEACDPNAPSNCGVGPCDVENATCRGNEKVGCQTDADCGGHCMQQGDPMECNCAYGNN
jgi:hypothetical protein